MNRKKDPKKRRRIPRIKMKTDVDGALWPPSVRYMVPIALKSGFGLIKDWDKLVADCLFELQLCVTALGDAGAKNRYYKLERRLQVLRGQLEMFP